jgi:hypothetical protein
MLTVLQAPLFFTGAAAYAESEVLAQVDSTSTASSSGIASDSTAAAEQQYSQLTKQILLAGIELSGSV